MSNEANKHEHVNLAWLNNSLLETMMFSDGDENEHVISHEVARGSAAGENYSTDIFRITVHYTRRGQPETRSLVVKAVPNKEEYIRLTSESGMFRREELALSSAVPSMHHLLEEASPSQFRPFSPKCLYRNSNPDAIVMEDLKEQGFKLPKRTLGLDMDHSMLVMRKLATFHASSVVLHEKNPQIIQPFYEHINEKIKGCIYMFFGRGMKSFANEVESWPDYKDRYAKKLQDIAEKTTDFMTEIIIKRDDNEFNVFRHGDLWLNNMMFLYSDETGKNVEDVRFLDYQCCHFGDPATDILYFLSTSVSTDLLDEHDKLVEEYYVTLKQTLTLLGHEHLAPSMAQLQKQLEDKSKYAVITCATVLPVVLADSNDIPDMEQVIKKESSVHFSDDFKRVVKKYLPVLERKGWL